MVLLALKVLLALRVRRALKVQPVLRVRRVRRVLKVCPVVAVITSLARKLQTQPYPIHHPTSASTQAAYCQRLYPTLPGLASRSLVA